MTPIQSVNVVLAGVVISHLFLAIIIVHRTAALLRSIIIGAGDVQ
jgi:hypothetical protein